MNQYGRTAHGGLAVRPGPRLLELRVSRDYRWLNHAIAGCALLS